MSFIKDVFSSGKSASSKRLITVALVVVYIVNNYVLLFKKSDVINKDLFQTITNDIFWLILIFGGFIATEKVWDFMQHRANIIGQIGVAKARTGAPDVLVKQNVENQEVVKE